MDDNGATTQPTQAATQLASQQDSADESDVWGLLLPCNSLNRYISRVNFKHSKLEYTVGRSTGNDIALMRASTVSSKHCVIEWDGDVTASSAVKVTDLSLNGTWINGEKIGKGKSKLLNDGNEIAFGVATPQPPERAAQDYRYVFRRKVAGSSYTGLESFYDLQHVLGRGSFATVMKALHKTEGRWYAVKIIQANKLKKGGGVERSIDESGDPMDNIPVAFKREIEILGRLRHPNICQFKEVFFESSSISVVLEWVKGGDLLSYLENHKELPEPEAQYITYQICDALAYVHGLGIAHRDLKPENILLTDDNPPVVKIADFGLAKAVDTLTALHTLCGTPAYLAPEVVTQNGDHSGYDHVVDSWSVGVIVYSMLTMCTPFYEDSAITDMTTQIANRRVEWTLLDSFNVSELGQSFIRSLLEYDPRRRITLTAARDHPWLASQAALHRPSTDSSQPPPAPQPWPQPPSSLSAARLPPHSSPAPAPAVAQSSLADASMRSALSAGMSLDTPSFAMAVEPPSQDALAADEGLLPHENPTPAEPSRPGTPEADDARPSSPPSDGQSQRVQRRADILWRAQQMGVELPAPSQDMHAWAAADAGTDPGASADAKPPAEGPVPDVVPVKDATQEGSGAAPEPASEPPAQSPARLPSGSKRKAEDTDSEPDADAIDPAAGDGEADGGEAASKAGRRTRHSKRLRTESQMDTSQATEGSTED